MTARIDPADVAAIVARLTEIGAHTEAATVTALATDLAASRLLAPQRDWWADIAASVGRGCVTLPDVAVAVREVVERKDAEIAQLRAGASTVGALLATDPAGMVVELHDLDFRRWYQAARRPYGVTGRPYLASAWRREWSTSYDVSHDLHWPARLVSTEESDADPHTRGPIGGAP